jgi:hypothetical protein
MRTAAAVAFLLAATPLVHGAGDDGLVGYWTFDEGLGETVFDGSGRNASEPVKKFRDLFTGSEPRGDELQSGRSSPSGRTDGR